MSGKLVYYKEKRTIVPEWARDYMRVMEERMGEWVGDKEYWEDPVGFKRCDECDNGIAPTWEYCPWCGQKLKAESGSPAA